MPAILDHLLKCEGLSTLHSHGKDSRKAVPVAAVDHHKLVRDIPGRVPDYGAFRVRADLFDMGKRPSNGGVSPGAPTSPFPVLGFRRNSRRSHLASHRGDNPRDKKVQACQPVAVDCGRFDGSHAGVKLRSLRRMGVGDVQNTGRKSLPGPTSS